jgi:eukaryotic-like serine/threonine-protein kinase
MTDSFDQAYRMIERLPPGDALTAQRAVSADGTEVVVKTVQPAAPASFVGALARQAGIVSPHLERIVAWEEHGELVVVATEPVTGQAVGDLLTAPAPPPEEEVSSLGIDAALGLAALHNHGLIHGGVKPSTLVRTGAGAVLVDAGFSQAQGGADLTESSPPQAAAYVSPEEATGRPLVPASDVYSLGVVLYQLATGRLPFDGPNAEVVARAHVDTPVMPPRQLVPAIRVALQAIILRALAKTPDERYANGSELFEALDNELQATRVMGAAPAVAPPPPARRSRWPWAVAIVAVVIAAVLVALWLGGVFTEKVTVPDVTGNTLSKATTALDKAGFKVGTVSYQQATGKAQGTVVSQTPAGGSSAKKGSAVELVAVGTSVQVVPNVVGMTQSEATTALAQAGLTLGTVSGVYSSSAPQGIVTGQAPAATITVPSGSKVGLTVSRGPTPTTSPQATAVPDVTGKTQSSAVSTLQAAGFAVVVEQISSTTTAAGLVIDQTPSGGVLAQPGTSVTIVVSTGSPTPATSPSP